MISVSALKAKEGERASRGMGSPERTKPSITPGASRGTGGEKTRKPREGCDPVPFVTPRWGCLLLPGGYIAIYLHIVTRFPLVPQGRHVGRKRMTRKPNPVRACSVSFEIIAPEVPNVSNCR